MNQDIDEDMEIDDTKFANYWCQFTLESDSLTRLLDSRCHM